MAGVPQPLGKTFQITNPDGTPTDYFIRWAQERQIDISGGITAAQAQTIIDTWAAARDIVAGVALDGGGNLSSDITIDHGNSSVTPGTYGDSTHVPQLTVDAQGHITNVSPVAISGGGGARTTIGDISSSLNARATPTVNFYLMRFITVDEAFTLSKVAFMMDSAVATTRYQPFVYGVTSAVGAPGTLLGSGPQVIGVTAGYNEAPLTSPVALTKGQQVWVGASVTTAAFANLWHGSGLGAFATNGGSTVPAGTAPAVTNVTTYGSVYGFWGVA